ncbi:MAG TPA: dipeptidase [Beijerinckiaceae bacterium]|nr:dipeptidase [Beijerinckiaceae bacterium]
MGLDRVLDRIDADVPKALERLFALIRIPSISTDSAYAKDVVACAAALKADVDSLGFQTTIHPTAGHPVVVAHRPKTGAPHVLFYGHYDVQPVDPEALWTEPPFAPSVKEIAPGRKVITGRGSADDKGQVMTFIEACRAFLATTGDLPVGVTLLIEGEEESGSPNLPAFVETHRKQLQADIGLVCDTGMWDADTPAITTSLRGLVYQEIVVRCADRDLHSGLYGGAAANPAHVLARIITSLHDRNGRVRIPGFYKGVTNPPAAQLANWKSLGLTEAEFLGPIGLKHSVGEKGRELIEHIQSRPTCDVNGIWGGYTGEGAKTVIAAEARAKISFRLVGQQDPKAIAKAFAAYVKRQVPKDCSVEVIPMKGSRAFEVDYNAPAIAAARTALRQEWGREAAAIGSGGSIPIVGDFKRILGLDCVMVGFGLEDDRVHSPNEKYDLKSFQKGTRSWARILDALARMKPAKEPAR